MVANTGGWKSRKLWFSVFAIGMIYAGAKTAIESKAFESVYSTMVGGIVGIAGMFLVGNVSTKWVAAKGEAAKNPNPTVAARPLDFEVPSETSPQEEETPLDTHAEGHLSVRKPIR